MASSTSTASQTPIVQPAFATQLTATKDQAMGLTPNLQKGYMIWDVAGGNMGYTGGAYGGRCTFNFMYNPEQVNASYSIQDTSLQAALMFNNPGASSVVAVPLSQYVSWTLYFDRTFEVNYGQPSGANNDPAIIGVQADVLQMMQFTGMLSNQMNSSTTSAGSLLANKGGIMGNIYSWVYFGQNVDQQGSANGGNSAAANRLGYFGFVSGWEVTYTAWTQNMVPYRCSMSVSFQILAAPSMATASNSLVTSGLLDAYGTLQNYQSLLGTTNAPGN